ncbi:hypothetical protein M407DRAFT_26461 [Tulasnella calospora MUT 4182]|uniref:SPIN90/Ldb17 leucine-rich domain-containing protein n=1 Tax=Tulasnella calospora MUT 4182 TaxID=1051891 RepID=A0A0C3KRN0_9AGAM|nr:hypothetical protein M407DRAFT_26461 [Tulasnella calospora MUT 4182]
MDLGVVYHIETPQQFWAELEDTIGITGDTSLAGIDYALRAFVTLCANNHDRFLQTNAQLDHACELLLESELFASHSQRTTDHIVNDAKSNIDNHAQLILYKILLHHGYRQPAFFKNLRKWSPLIPFLMDHIVLEIDDLHGGASSYGGGLMGMGLPIEARLRNLSVVLLYEICRVQKIDAADLKLFTEDFINRLFDLVEETRNYWDETLNYGLIRLIVSLNEQFMVASLPPPSKHSPTSSHSSTRAGTRSPALGGSSVPGSSGRDSPSPPPLSNRVLAVLMRRVGDSKTFGENLIFMLNRAENTPEDLCMQLLVLKLLYLLFTTPGTQEYFYTNDLRVLVDVFIRELVDLPDESESLRHTYLRVLHPLVTNTQLKAHPYKRLQIRNVLQSLVAHAHIRDVSQTTRRLVDRCLKAPWCVALDAELVALKGNQCETRSVDSGVNAKSKSSFVPGDDPKAASTTKTLHKSASMTFAQSGSGSGGGATGLSRTPLKGAAAAAGLSLSGSKNSDTSTSASAPALAGMDGDRPPRSADAATHSFTNHPPNGRPERKAAGPTVVSLQPPNLESLSISDPSGPADDIPASDSTHYLPHLQVTRSATINVTAPTPIKENFHQTDASLQNELDGGAPRPRASSMADKGKGKGKPLSPPPRPPSSRKPTPSPDVHLPTRNNSLGEVSQTGFSSGERQDLTALKPVEGVRVARRAPPTPPPTKQRRKAPAVPNGGRKGPVSAAGSTMTTIASTNAGNVGLEMPVGRWAVPS